MAYEIPAAASLIGLAGFQVWDAWGKTAPSFRELRQSPAGDPGQLQALVDSTLGVGTLALGLGVAFAVLTKDATALFIMLGILGALALWSYQILIAEDVK